MKKNTKTLISTLLTGCLALSPCFAEEETDTTRKYKINDKEVSLAEYAQFVKDKKLSTPELDEIVAKAIKDGKIKVITGKDGKQRFVDPNQKVAEDKCRVEKRTLSSLKEFKALMEWVKKQKQLNPENIKIGPISGNMQHKDPKTGKPVGKAIDLSKMTLEQIEAMIKETEMKAKAEGQDTQTPTQENDK